MHACTANDESSSIKKAATTHVQDMRACSSVACMQTDDASRHLLVLTKAVEAGRARWHLRTCSWEARWPGRGRCREDCEGLLLPPSPSTQSTGAGRPMSGMELPRWRSA